MSLLKIFIAFSISFSLSLPAMAKDDAIQEKEFTGKLIKKNNSTYLSYKKGSKTEHLSIHASNHIFCGHDVWILGHIEINSRYLHTKELVTAKKASIEGKVGQGIAIVGSLRPNSFQGLNFIPENPKAIEQMGGIDILHVVWPDEHYMKGAKTYIHRALVKGVVVGNSLYVSPEPYSFHVIAQKAKIEIGDNVIVTGNLLDRDSAGDDSSYRNHFVGNSLTYGDGSSDSYGLNKFGGEFFVEERSDVYVQNKFTGEFVPAEFERSEILATPIDERVADLMQDQTPVIMTGEMTSENHILVHDAKPYQENVGTPQITQKQIDKKNRPLPSSKKSTSQQKSIPKQNSVTSTESLEGKRYGHLKVVADNKRPTQCNEALSSDKPRPKLFIVPKNTTEKK